MAGHSDSTGGGSQADLRRPQWMTDDHGRRWFADVEKRSGYPVGPIRPRFDAPWYPDQSALKIDPDDPSHIRIDYEALLAERQEAHALYHQRAVEEAASRQWPVPELGEPYRRELQLIIGKPPQPIEPVVAAMQGNKYILGLTTRVDPRLVEFIETPAHKHEQMLRALPDFRDEELMDLEEEVDPDAIGGRRVNPSRKVRQKREDAA